MGKFVAEQFPHMIGIAHSTGADAPGGGGCVRLHRGEQFTDETRWGPIDQTDPAAGTAGPVIVGTPLVEGREHHPTQEVTTSKAASGMGSASASAVRQVMSSCSRAAR